MHVCWYLIIDWTTFMLISSKSVHLDRQTLKAKVVPVFNYELHHEDVWGSGGIAPRVLNLGTR